MPDWILPSALGALGAIIWYLARRMMAKQDALESGLHTKLDSIKEYMQSELRSMDVRLSVVETLVLPPKK